MTMEQFSLDKGLVIDFFAGGGGASTGVEQAIGRPVDIAVNHDPDAILMYKTNHPDTLCQGFPKSYIIDHDYTGKAYPKSKQVARIGNSVVPIMAREIVSANIA